MSVLFSFNIKKFPRPQVNREPLRKEGLYLNGTNGSTIILIHGLTGTPKEMMFLATFFNRKGYSVICPRLANHGEPIEVLQRTEWKDFYESVRRAMLDKDMMCNRRGSVFVAGLSMGALLALLLAMEFKEIISGASCLSPTLFYDGWNMPWSKYLLPIVYFIPALSHFFYFKEETPYGIKNEAIRERVHRYYSKAQLNDIVNIDQYGYPYFPVALLYQLHLLVQHITKKLPCIHFPVQLIQAKDDDMTSIKNSEFIYDRIHSETKELVLLYNSYHVITADDERNIVADKMEQFFSRISEGHPK